MGWYNSSWQYRIPITITNTGSELSDYQVPVLLGSSFPWSHANSYGSDIRFTANNGTTEIPYWIESWASLTSASIWVKVPLVAAGTTTTIYLYYGNSTASIASNGTNTFEFFDDFENGLTKWTASSGTWTTLQATQQDGSTGSYVGQGEVASGNQVLQSIGFTGTDYITEVYGRQNSGNCWGLCTRATAFNDFYVSVLYDNHDAENNLYTYEWNSSTHPFWATAIGTINPNVWYKMTVKVFENNIQVFINDYQWQDIQDSNNSSGMVALWVQATATAQFNDLRVRKYAAFEPSTIVGTEQNRPPLLDIVTVKTDVSCFEGSDGAIDITVTGGDGTYIYSWSNGQTTEDLSGLTAGIYSVHVEDGTGYIGDQSITITQPDALSLTYGISEPYSCVTGTATVVITATGGTPPYSGTGTFTQGDGTTEYPVTDANSCPASIGVTVEPPSPWLLDSGWQYRESVEISNPGGTALTDFQVQVGLNEAFDFSKTNSDGSDIRFTSGDGSSMIPYWIEIWSPSADTASIWVKVPTIPVSGTTIYMYYGNSAATGASDGTATFKFFDDFDEGDNTPGEWTGGYVAHDWKYSMHMQEGALNYAIIRAQNDWTTESLDSEIEQEFAYMHGQVLGNGQINGLVSEPVYCYGLVLSNFALGYLYFRDINSTLAQQCYNDMVLVYGYVRDTYGIPTTAPDYSIALAGFSNAWKAFNAYGNTILADEARGIVLNYVTAFTQSSGFWTGNPGGVQDELKRDFGVILAYDVTGDHTYLEKVRDNMNWILDNRFLESNGGITWTSPVEGGEFYECHQQWFMITARMLYDRDDAFNYLAQGQAAWHFLTDNNYAGFDLYVHNYDNHNAFFCYRKVLTDGSYQTDNFKGSYEIGAALFGMALNYGWVSSYQSSHSGGRTFNYLNEMLIQIKNLPADRGFFSSAGNWVRLLSWSATTYQPDQTLWSRVGIPTAQLVEHDSGNALSIRGGSHNDLYATVDTEFDNFIFEAEVNMTLDVNNSCNPEIGFHYTDLTHRYFTMMRGESQNDLFIRRIEGIGTAYDNAVAYNYTGGIYYNYKMAVSGNEIKLYLNDALTMDYTDNGNILTGGFSIGNYTGTPVYYDDVRVREYAATEPVAIIGSRQFYDIQWTGAGATNDWDDPDNWSACIVPTSDNDVAIFNANNDPVITGYVECNNLIIEPSGCLTIADGGDLAAVSITINSASTSSSGSLIVEENGTVDGSIPVTYNRFLRPEGTRGDRHFFSSPVGGLEVSDFLDANSGKIAQDMDEVYQLWEWDELTGGWPLIEDPVSYGLFISGKGYNVDQATGSDGLLTFTGSVVNSATFEATSPYANAPEYIDRTDAFDYGLGNTDPALWADPVTRNWTIGYGGGGWNLMGNPFTSAMDAALFISSNTGKFDPWYQALYLYDGREGEDDYKYVASTVPGWEPEYEEGGSVGDVVQVGQGFFVLALYNEVGFEFTPDMQVHSTGVPLLKSAKAEDPWPGLKLKVRSGEKERATTIVYNDEMTTGNDPGYDVGQLSTYPDVEVYTSLVEKDNSVNFARQALPISGANQIIVPVGIDSKKGGEVTFTAFTVPLGNYKFWLEDRTTGIFTNLNANTYTVTLPAETYGTGRFFIIASTNTPTGIEKPLAEDTSIRVWTSDKKVIIKGDVSDLAICEVYDLRGKKILETRLTDGELNTVTLPSGLHGVYLVRVVDGVKVITRKVALL